MRSQLFVSFAALIVPGILASPAPHGHVLHERRDFDHPAWSKVSTPDPSGLVPVRIGMTQSNADRIDELLMEVADAESPKYGKHYTQDQVIDLFAPSDDTVAAIRGWLESAGVAKDRVTQSVNKQWMQFDSTVADLEDLLKTKFHVYEHELGHSHLACEKYHVPSHISHHIDYITPGVKMMHLGDGKPTSKKRSLEKRAKYTGSRYKSPHSVKEFQDGKEAQIHANAKSGSLGLCSAVITPQCLKAMYNISAPSVEPAGEILGIFESLGDHYSQEDLNLYFKAIATNIPQGTHPVLKGIDGGTGPTNVQQAGLESNLDFQLSYGVIYPGKSVLFSTDDNPTQNNYVYSGFLNNFFDGIDGSYCTFNPFNQKLPPKQDPHYPNKVPGGYHGQLQCGKYKPTPVISISYGGSEFGLSGLYQRRQCLEIAKLGMQGVSIVVSSGDDGVANFPGFPSPNGCISPSLKYTPRKNGTIFAPDFPASCPYITALGSTFLPAGADPKKDEEISTTRFPSGGGFSNIFPRASYQKSAVSSWFAKYPPPYPAYSTAHNRHIGSNGGIFNRNGRGYPDFAAVGDNVLIYGAGRPLTIGGTSASAPFFASLLARINVEREAQGKGPVGFVNPTLYKNTDVFHDITTGSNPGCGTDGFSAAPGWDPVSGLGTPNYGKMLDLFLGLP